MNEERITYDQLKQQGIKSTKIIVTKRANKNDIFLELEIPEGTNEKKKQIAENIDTISLYGVRTSTEESGPFFVAVIEEGILSVYEEVVYKISEEKDNIRNMRIYIPIW